ncbi:MAG TPA: TolC family protein [Vicinamibacterales bacterium]|nr:TolC family protein [Vicinamibacterales bacterium]
MFASRALRYGRGVRTLLVCALGALVNTSVALGSAQAQTPSPPGVVAAISPNELIRRAFDANRELAAARLDLERGRARLRQAGLRSNPTLDIEHTTGRLTGSPDERELSVGVALPVDIGARRQRRIDVASAELAVIEAEVADRERQLARNVLAAYVDAVAAIRELDTTERLRQLDEQMARVVRIRVEEQDAPPLELSLLLTEVARLEARLALLRGRVDAALIAVGQLIGAPQETLTLQSSQSSLDAVSVPRVLEAAVATALEQRADVTVARLSEQAAEAGVRLARADAWPDLTVSAAYRTNHGVSDLPRPLIAVPDTDHVVAFGASIGLPFFNKNQGARAESAVIVRQARVRRELVEQTVRAEVTSAFRRAAAAQTALTLYEQGVLTRSDDNIRIMRAAYELGEFRITDVIAEQRRLLESQQEYTAALTERYRAIVDLRAAVGLAGWQP